jgi:hypothetical protein
MTSEFSEQAKVFVSYRWESESHKKWVLLFVRALKSRGIVVAHDQDAKKADFRPDLWPALLIGEIQSSHIFIPILTHGYVERISDFFQSNPLSQFRITIRTELRSSGRTQGMRDDGTEDGWVFDEFQAFLQQHIIRRDKLNGGMPMAAILRDDCENVLPANFPRQNLSDFRHVEFDAHNPSVESLIDKFSALVFKFAAEYPIPSTSNPYEGYFR